MAEISVDDLINKNISEINDIVNIFIKKSLHIRKGIAQGQDPELCMLSIIRDTHLCNLLFRYVGMMTLLSADPQWQVIDNQMMEYIQNYYNNERFKNKLIELHEYYLKTYQKSKINYDYCKFLDKMINKSEITKKGFEIKKEIRMIENKIFNILNINPIVKIATRHFKRIPTQYEIKQNKAIVVLNHDNYLDLLDNIDDMNIRQQIEKQYISRTQNTLVDFSKLILARKILAEQCGYSTYFKFINRGKNDNSETIKELITELNQKINKKIQIELNKIHQYYARNNISGNNKISLCDIIKYKKIHRNNTKFDPKNVVYVVFQMLDKYFNIKIEKINNKIWSNNVLVYNMKDKQTDKLLGKLFMDIMFDENKKITKLISIRLSDKMMIELENNTNKNRSKAEIALIANYKNEKSMTYDDVILLFREFGYIIKSVCYESRVGLINHDEEFSNYLPSLMEYIAWDRDTIRLIIGDADPSIIDHIEISRYIDMCTNMKIKCINAKFDYLLHNSEPLMNILIKSIDNNVDTSNVILETYKEIHKEIMSPIENIFMDNIEYIDPMTIIQEINNSQGVLYAYLMNEIFAYTSYWIIKEKKETDFRECVLNNGVDNYRDLVRNFLNKININCFTLFVKNVIKTDLIEDFITEDINYFDDNEHESDSDKEDIIQINRFRGSYQQP